MSDVFGVFRFLMLRTAKNKLLRQLRRLREPRYLVPTAVSVLWIVFWMSNAFRGGLRGRPGGRLSEYVGAEAFDAFAVMGGVLLLVWTAFLWILPSKGAVLEFARAEIHFLFPAPVTRRQIVHYKLMRAQTGIFFGALITSFFWGRGLASAGGWGRLLGIWLLYATLHLHTMGAGFVRSDLLEQGVSGLRRRIVPFLALVAFVIVAGFGVRESWPAIVAAGRAVGGEDRWTSGGMAAFLGTIARVGTSGALGVALWPFTVFPRLILAQGPGDFVRWLPPAFVILLANYLWVIRSDTAFEEASVEAAQKRAERMEATKSKRLRGGTLPVRVRAFPWRLSPRGRPAVALVWKNLVSLMRVTPVRALIGLGAFLFGMVGLVIGLNDAGAPYGLIAAFLAALIALFTALFGPVFVRNDLREDLFHIDALKTFPLPGYAVVRAEILGSWIVLAGIELAALAGAAMALAWVGTSALGVLGLEAIPAAAWWFAGLLAAGLLLPAVTGIQITLQNALVLLFPAWVALANSRARGFEASGQRMLTMIGSGIVLLVCLVPAAISGAVAAWLLAGLIGAPALVIGAAVAAGWLHVEVWWATRFLGGLLDRLDPSTAGIEAPEA
jgi:hypothetical protein